MCELCLVPQPRHLIRGQGAFRPDADTRIVLDIASKGLSWQGVTALQRDVRHSLGIPAPILRSNTNPPPKNAISLSVNPSALPALESRHDLGRHAKACAEQAYALTISVDGVSAEARTGVGLRHALQTLRQIARTSGSHWPAVSIVDWPALPYRGLMLDVSRGKVPTLATLKEIVEFLSLYKINVLQLYTEHTFDFPRHPRIGQGCDPLTPEDMLGLDDHCRQRYVTLMPNVNSFGHCAHLLSLPDYEHLAESPARWSLCPTDEDTYDLLDELYGDMLPSFRSTVFNVGCDETYDLGQGRSAEAARARGLGRVYFEHILRLRELAARHGRTIQIWGDILLRHPELVPELPKDVTLLDWHYGAAEDYSSVRLFAESGRTFWVCPGTSSWNTLFPRIENANANIRTLARLGAEHGAEGLLNTDWGDRGHYQPLGQCWYGYAYGAEQAWTGGRTDESVFDHCYGPLAFGAHGQRVVEAMRILGRAQTLPGMPRSNGSNNVYGMLDEPLVGEIAPAIPPNTLAALAGDVRRAEDLLRDARASTSDTLSVDEMLLSCRWIDFAAAKMTVTQAILGAMADASSGDVDGIDRLTASAAALEELRDRLARLMETFTSQWMQRARRSEIAISLGHMKRLDERLASACTWLTQRAEMVDAEPAVRWRLDTYAESAGGYEVLGQGFRRHMKEAGIEL